MSGEEFSHDIDSPPHNYLIFKVLYIQIVIKFQYFTFKNIRRLFMYIQG